MISGHKKGLMAWQSSGFWAIWTHPRCGAKRSPHPMLTKESRTYKLAKAALLAVLLAVTPVTGILKAQTRPLPGAQKRRLIRLVGIR